jgi:hypothetical protein
LHCAYLGRGARESGSCQPRTRRGERALRGRAARFAFVVDFFATVVRFFAPPMRDDDDAIFVVRRVIVPVDAPISISSGMRVWIDFERTTLLRFLARGMCPSWLRRAPARSLPSFALRRASLLRERRARGADRSIEASSPTTAVNEAAT